MASSVQPAATVQPPEAHDDIIYPSAIPFVLVHLGTLAAFWTGVSAKSLWLAFVLYVVRMFGVTAGYHRYFSHRAFKTSRVGQFVLAFLAQSSAQRGVLWWASKHRHHHKFSDLPEDVHSPAQHGFLFSHIGWIFTKRHHDDTDLSSVPDLTKFPEIVWLNKWRYFPAAVLAVACFLFDGWTGFVVGFLWSTVVLYHGTFFINSLAHVYGNRRYVTGDDSRNNWFLAIITLGEGWHNNHHAYMASTRQGFRWYEFDPTYYALTAMSWVGLTWDLNAPPEAIVRNEKPVARGVIEKVAHQLAGTVDVERLAAELRDKLAHTPTWDELKARLQNRREQAAAALGEMHLPHVPTREELRQRALQMIAATPSMDEIVARARELVMERLVVQLEPALA